MIHTATVKSPERNGVEKEENRSATAVITQSSRKIKPIATSAGPTIPSV